VEPQPVSVRPRPASSAALSTMNHNNSSSSHLSVLAKVLRLFRSHSDSSMPRPPSPPRRRSAAAGPPRSASLSPCTVTGQQQVGCRSATKVIQPATRLNEFARSCFFNASAVQSKFKRSAFLAIFQFFSPPKIFQGLAPIWVRR